LGNANGIYGVEVKKIVLALADPGKKVMVQK
jgi:hypothetical protein